MDLERLPTSKLVPGYNVDEFHTDELFSTNKERRGKARKAFSISAFLSHDFKTLGILSQMGIPIRLA